MACNRTDCGTAIGLPCEAGHLSPNDCPDFNKTATPSPVQTGNEVCLPWTGRALGLNDLALANARGTCAMVGVVGTVGSGKTSLLTALFTHLSRTGHVSDHWFAGSLTIRGWSQLRQYTRWPSQIGPGFPPHTPDTGGRIPSILHLAFRSGNSMVRDILFTDAPGEWFTRWINNRSAPGTEGARWIAENCTHFWLATDVNSFVGDGVGIARTTTRTLARVLAEAAQGRPVAAVWTKTDLPRDLEVENEIREGVKRHLPSSRPFDLAVGDKTCLDLITWTLLESLPVRPSPTRPLSAFTGYGFQEPQ